MVAIVSGNSLGLDLTSFTTLGQRLRAGSAATGRSGEQGFVNVANGNLVLQDRDTYLQSRGDDIAVVRTYNSQGKLNDENADNWGIGAYVQPLTVAGTLNASGSTIARTGRDGSEAIYAYDTTRALYVSTAGSGAYDTIKYISSSTQFEWTDGDTGVKQTYEGSGQYRLLSAKDPSGNTTTYAYNAAGRLASAASASGETVYYDFTGNNLTQIRVVNSANATSTQVRYAYDASNRLSTVTVDLSPADNADSDGKVYQSTYTYDGSSNRVASVTQTDGSKLSFIYVQVGSDYRVASVTDGLNQVTRYTYDTANRRTTVTDPLGMVSTYEYDTAGQLTKATAPSVGGVSQATVFAYNATGDVVSVTDAEGRAVAYGYDANGNQTLQRDQAGNTLTRTYDARNQLLTETSYLVPDPDGAGSAQPSSPITTRYAYDASGRNLLRFVVSAEGHVTENKYDSYGQLTSVVKYPAAVYNVSLLAANASLSESTLASWASSQNLTRTQRTDYAYDVRGQVSSATAFGTIDTTGAGVADATASVTRYTYDQIGQLLQTISATAGVTSYVYDGLGRVSSSTDAMGAVTLTQYTDASRKTIVTRANGLITTQLYDAAGRLVSVAQANAGGTTLGETKYYYDADNRLRMTQDPTGVRSWLLYDEAGRKVGEIDGNGSLTEYTYDKNNLLTQRLAYATTVNTAALVDAQGAPLTTVMLADVRPVSSLNDQKTVTAYDAANRLSRTATFTGNTASVIETLYDGASRVTGTIQYATGVSASSAVAGTVNTPASTVLDRPTRNFYDSDGRLSGTLDAEGYLTTFKYDAAGRLIEKLAYENATAPNLRVSGTLAQLLPVAGAGDAKTIDLYNNKGLLAATVDAESYLTEYVYDTNGSLTQTVRYASRVSATVTTSSPVVSIRPPASAGDQTTTTAYDTLGRIASRTSFEGTVTSYAYDIVGNLVSTVSAVSTAEARTLLARYDLQGRLTGELSAEGALKLTGGQTQAQIDAIWSQYSVVHTYDAAGRRTSSTDAAGSKTFFFYDVDGNLTHTVNALGEVKEQRFDALGQLSSTVAYGTRINTSGLTGGLANATLTNAVAAAANPALDSVVSFTYTRDGRTASAVDALGNATSYSYNAFGNLVSRSQSIGDGRTLSETYGIDHRGLQASAMTTDASGMLKVTLAAHDAFGRTTNTVTPNGVLTRRYYDRLGRVIATTDPVNSSRYTTYDAFSRVLIQTDALGKATTYAYSNTARTMTTTTPEGVVTTNSFTRLGQVLSVSDGKGQLTSYQYDRNGNLVKTSTPLTTTASTYDAINRVTQSIDANGISTVYAYDAANRVLTRRVDPLGLNLTTAYQYDAKSQRVSVTDATGIVTQTQFDRKGQVLKQIVDPSGLNLQTVYAYDGRGRTLSVTSPGGTTVQYAYDTLGRRTQERTDPSGLNLVRSWSYDHSDNVVSRTDANGQVTRYGYDKNNRLILTVDPLGNLSGNEYDEEGRIVKTTNYATPITIADIPQPLDAHYEETLRIQTTKSDRVEERTYDNDGRLISTIDGMGAYVHYAYDANGNVVERKAYADRIDLERWSLYHDADESPRPTENPAHDQTVRTVYDALNRAVYSINGAGAVVAQTYDGNGNVLQRTAYAKGISTTTDITQTALSAAVAKVADTSHDSSIRQVWDTANRLSWSVDGVGAVKQFVYDKNGNLVRQVAYSTAIETGTTPSGVASVPALDRAVSMAYDSANRLVFQVDALNVLTEQAYDGNGNVVRRTKYANSLVSVPALGTAGSAAAIRAAISANDSSDRTTRFGYDAAGRQVLAFDAVGSVSEMQYDGAGHLIATTKYGNAVSTGAFATLGSTWALSSLRGLVTANTAADRTTKTAYDAAGRAIYTVDPMGAVKANQYDGLGRISRSTRYANLLPPGTANSASAITVAISASADSDQTEIFDYDAAGLLISSTDAMGATETYGYNALGLKTSFTNKNGSTWTYDYNAAGRLITEFSPWVEVSSVANDSTGRLAVNGSQSSAGSIVTSMGYDALGNLLQRIEAYGRPEQRSTLYEYDTLGRQVRTVFPPTLLDNRALGLPASDAAVRPDMLGAVSTVTRYDTLGNAISSTDTSGYTAYKAYDRSGQVAYEVDVDGYVTEYARNAWGESVSMSRHANRLTAVDANPAVLSKQQIQDMVGAPGFSQSLDRTLYMEYDRAGRVVTVREPVVFVLNGDNGQQSWNSKVTTNAYNAFGQVIETSVVADSASGSKATTTFFHNKRGENVASIDALGYITTQTYDAAGNVVEHVEYAAAAPGWILGNPIPDTSNRRATTYAYDRDGRKLRETAKAVTYGSVSSDAAPNASQVTSDVSTWYAYDRVGNIVTQTDRVGSTTRTTYDALGRVRSVSKPVNAGVALVTTYLHDALGNSVAQFETQQPSGIWDGVGGVDAGSTLAINSTLESNQYLSSANGRFRLIMQADGNLVIYDSSLASSIWSSGTRAPANTVPRLEFQQSDGNIVIYAYDDAIWSAGTAAGNRLVMQDDGNLVVYGGADGNTAVWYSNTVRVNSTTQHAAYSAYDSLGHVIQSTDASGFNHYAAYNARGQVSREWTHVASAANADGTGFTTATSYTAYTYDKRGHATVIATPKSSARINGSGVSFDATGENQTIVAFNAFGEVVAKSINGQQTEYYDYDGAGRLWRTNSGDGIDKVYLYDQRGNQTAEIRSAGDAGTSYNLRSVGSADAAFAASTGNSLIRTNMRYDLLGREIQRSKPGYTIASGGGVSVTSNSLSASIQSRQNGNNTVSVSWSAPLNALGPGMVQVVLEYLDDAGRAAAKTFNFSGDVANAGALVAWPDDQSATGISRIIKVRVYKADYTGAMRPTYQHDEMGYGGEVFEVDAVTDRNARNVLSFRQVGSSTWITVPDDQLFNFGSKLRFNAAALTSGRYEYRVITDTSGGSLGVTASGQVNIIQVPLGPITSPIGFNQAGIAGAGMFVWQGVPGDTQVLQVRARSSSDPWQVKPTINPKPGWYAADLNGMPPGDYEYQLLWTHPGELAPYAKASGDMHVSAPTPATMTTQTLPMVSGLRGTTDQYTRPQLQWTTALGWSGISFEYSSDGVNWATLPIGVRMDGATLGYGSTLLAGMSLLSDNGQYRLEMQNDGNLVIYDANSNPIWNVAREIGSTAYANVPNRLVMQGDGNLVLYNNSGNPIWWPNHPYAPSTYAFGHHLTLGSNGNLTVYHSSGEYVWDLGIDFSQNYNLPQTRAVYVDLSDFARNTEYHFRILSADAGQGGAISSGTVGRLWIPTSYIPDPIFNSFTNATINKIVPGEPTKYYHSVTTPPNYSGAVDPNQSATINGINVTQRPVVNKIVDRWGNVVSVTDPRNSSWVTNYAYNADNQVIGVQMANVGGSAGIPYTQYYYDAAGRQIATRDANGHVNAIFYDQAGNAIQERHADRGVITSVFNAFGDKLSSTVSVTDSRSITTSYQYDAMHRLVRTVHAAEHVYTTDAYNNLFDQGVLNNAETNSYDALGRLVTSTNAAGQTTVYRRDALGQIVQKVSPMGRRTAYTFDATGNKTSETDPMGFRQSWDYDSFGRLNRSIDASGTVFAYGYDAARRLVSQTSTGGVHGGQSRSLRYDTAGNLIEERDNVLDKRSTYQYDLAGQRVRERTVQQGMVYQDNSMVYDALGRLRSATDGNAIVTMDYDAVGNRIKVTTHAALADATGRDTTRYYAYDEMNRQTLYDGLDPSGSSLVTADGRWGQGHLFTYDQTGNRTSDTSWGNVAQPNGVVKGRTTTRYEYDNLGRLSNAVRDDVIVDRRKYDAASRVVQQGSLRPSVDNGGLTTAYAQAINQGVPIDQTIGLETNVNAYDGDGRMIYQHIYKSDGTAARDVAYVGTGFNGNTLGYNDAGTLLAWQVSNFETNKTTLYANTYDSSGAGQRLTQTNAVTYGRGSDRGATTQAYDTNGYLVGVTDLIQPSANRTFVNDAQGIVLSVNQGGHFSRQFVVNGEVLGNYGDSVSNVTPRDSNGQAVFENKAEFNFGYAPISSGNPAARIGQYTVAVGDTLQSIARNAYGDQDLWYRIAEANGFSSNGDMHVGQSISIPSVTAGIRSNSNTFKPYDPSQITGDTTPAMAMPQAQKGGCGAVGTILMVVVAVAVTVMTSGVAATATGSAFAGGLIGGAAGAVASQAVGIAIGQQEGFNWKSVALAAISNGITQGVAPQMLEGTWAAENVMVRAAMTNSVTQGIGIATGLQKSFNWKSVAASAIGAGVGQVVGQALQDSGAFSGLDKFTASVARGTVAGMAVGTAASIARGGRIAVQQVATDAFGNALGQSLAAGNGQATGSSSGSGEDRLGAFIGQNQGAWNQRQANYDQMVDAFRSPTDYGRADDTLLAAGPNYSGGMGESDRDRNIARMLNMANEPEAMAFDGLLRVAPSGLVDMAPTKANAIRLGLMGPDGQTEGGWSSPVTQSNVVGVPLPPIENAYTPIEGFFQGRYSMAVQGLQDPNASFIDKAYYTLAGAAALPLAALETPITSLYNAGNNISLAAQYWAKGDLSTDPYEANIAKLSAVIHATNAANGLLGAAAMVPGAVKLAAPLRTPEEMAVAQFPGTAAMNERIWSQRQVISGHGGLPENETFVVPRGTSITFYAEPGATISNSLGNEIERSSVSSSLYRRTYSPGEVAPNPNLGPIANDWVSSQPVGTIIRVDRPTPLSELLGPNMGTVNWAACLSNPNLPGSQYMFTNIGKVPVK